VTVVAGANAWEASAGDSVLGYQGSLLLGQEMLITKPVFLYIPQRWL
jgi:hypothetical protein